MSLLEQLEVVRRLLSAMGEGEELEHAGEKHSIALCVAFQRVKTLKTDEKLDLIVAIEGLRMGSTAKGRLLAQVRGKCEATSRKRPLQDYVSWPNFCTPLVWRDISDNPQLATEILCQQLNSLGLILPSKDTEKSIAAHAIAAEYGQFAASVSEADAKRVFKGVGKRIKQLYKVEPSEFIAKLPPSPAAFLKSHPTMAKAVFSRENLPCACPLDHLIVSHAESKIRCRGENGETGLVSASSSQDCNQGFMRQMVCMMGALHRMVQPPQQTGLLTLLPPGPSFQGPSPGATRFQLLEDALVPKTSEKASEVLASSPPPCLALLDVAVTPKSSCSASLEGDLMRESVLKSRRELATDRAAATAAAKAATALAKAAAKPLKPKTTANPLKSKKKPLKRPASCMNKPPSWIKARPFGCPKCRNIPGCTRSCYIGRGEKVPK
jgi:hypothetical protein